MVNEARVIDLFKTLVKINAPARQERECVDYVKNLLAEMGLNPHEDDAGAAIGGNAGNVIATLPGNGHDGPHIFFSAHFDTVEPTAGLTIIEDDDIIKTDGTTILGADDKAGMVAAIEAVRMLQESGAKHGPVSLLFCVAEEVGLLGAANLKINDLGLDYGYILDTGPPVGSFVNRTATHDRLEVVIRGRPAHSGKDPEKGISAIQVAAEAISRMRLGRIDPETTANLGMIEGGSAVNVVPAYVRIRGEARSTDEATLNAQIEHMKECFENATKKFGAQVEIEHSRHYSSYVVPEDHRCVQDALRASRACGFDPTLRTTLGGSDANMFNAAGVPCIVVATGMDKIHTHEEQVSRRSIVENSQLAYTLALAAVDDQIGR